MGTIRIYSIVGTLLEIFPIGRKTSYAIRIVSSQLAGSLVGFTDWKLAFKTANRPPIGIEISDEERRRRGVAAIDEAFREHPRVE